MDKYNNDVLNFEQILNKRSDHRHKVLYDNSRILTNTCKIEDVISNVSEQIKAIQKADLVKKVPRQLENANFLKHFEFLPLNVLSDKVQKQEIQNKFETQCVSDTQLINLVENVESFASHSGVTQEFDTTFIHKPDANVNKELKAVKNEGEFDKYEQITEKNNKKSNKIYVPSDEAIQLKQSEININNNDQEVCDIFDNSDTEDNIAIFEPLEGNSKSPILNKVKPIVFRNTPLTSLVYNLESFEKFEAIALPVIEENADFLIAKKIINSQILNGELCIQSHKNPNPHNRESSKSPVFDVKIKRRNSETRSVNVNQQFIEHKSSPSVIEDEILFSSDEENFEPARDIEDLPLTCALKTSFYNQTGILDKTMYVGFQTASNKSIQIHRDSFVKAKNVLEETNVDIKALVNEFDGTFIEPSKLVEKNINVQDKLKATGQTNSFQTPMLTNTDNVQFQTANGKSIQISDQGLRKSKFFLEEFQNNLYDNDVEFKKEEEFEVKKTDVSDLKKPKYVRDSTQYETFHKKTERDNNDEPIKINDEIIVQEFEKSMINEEQEDDHNNIPQHKLFNITEEHILKQDFQGFKTASLKPIKISDEAVLKSSKIFEGIDGENKFPDGLKGTNKTDYTNCSPSCKGFFTASNKPIKISETALLKSKKIFEDINMKEDIEHNKGEIMSMTKDFQCRSEISKDIDVTGKLLNYNEIGYDKFGGFKTANNIPIKVSSKTLAKYKNVFDVIIEETKYPPSQESKQTKMNLQPITINNIEKKLSNSDSKNEDLNIKHNNNFNSNFKPCFQTEDEKVKVSEESLLPSQILFNNSKADISSKLNDFAFKGFQTASNKQINISKETLARSKRIFADIELDVDEDTIVKKMKNVNETRRLAKDNKEMQNFKGLQTACNKKMIVTEQTLDKYNSMFDNKDADLGKELSDFKSKSELTMSTLYTANKNTVDIICEDTNPTLLHSPTIKQSSSNFKGFKTASNRPVIISKEALAKTKNIFNDIDSDTENNLQTSEIKPKNEMPSIKFQFQTANHKPVNISEEAIIASQKLLNDDMEKDHISLSKFQGFQTASKKSIAIFKDTLDKYKTMFDDIDTDLANDFVNENKQTILKPNTETVYKDLDDLSEDALANPAMQNYPVIKQSFSNFNGFKTASNRPVKVSTKALARTKNIFNDIDIDTENNLQTPEIKPNNEVPSIKFQFQTANHKPVNISEEAVIASQKLFSIHTEKNQSSVPKAQEFQSASNKTVKISKEALAKNINVHDGIKIQPGCISDDQIQVKDIKTTTSAFKDLNNINDVGSKSYINVVYNKTSMNNNRDDINMKDIFNTQVENNFEYTLYTEDFFKDRTPVQCKRSGSPILSCPKSKKRKFQTPASVVRNILSAKSDTCQKNTDNTVYVFDDNYKKTKKFTLQDLDNMKNNNVNRIDKYILNFNYGNILDFKFKLRRNEVTDDIWSTDKIKEVFSAAVTNKIIPSGWIENHLKLIIWKLISYEIRFPHLFETVCTVRNVLEQLKYRYDRELYNVERPALRKILERDDVASKAMVLCVVGVYVDGVYVSRVSNLTDTIELLLTDGWYCIKASIDKYISKLIYDGKISVGMKLFIHGAELVNCEQGLAPWEDTSSVRLKISGNSTRRARWDARLGYHGNAALLSRLSTVRPEGGKVSKLRVFVTRVYPTLYIEKFEDGSTVTRSERLENMHQMKYENDRQLILERIYEEVEKEFSEQESQDSETYTDSGKFESGTQIAKIMKKHRDPAEFRANLTNTQLHLLQEYTVKQKDKQIELMQDIVREKIKNSSLGVARSVVPLLKIRVASVEGRERKICKGMLSIWRPNEALQEVIAENTWLDVYNVVPTAIRNSEIQLSASRHSIFQKSKVTHVEEINSCTDYLKRQCYQIKDIRNSKLFTENNEVDTVGFIISIEPSNKDFENSKQLYQNIYLADENKNILCINFWGGIKKFGFENILDTGQVIACVNLQKRSGNTMKNIPQYRATEFSYFTKTPKYDCLRKLCLELTKIFSGLDKRKFCLDCVAIKNNNAHTNLRLPDVSPYRINKSDYNISMNKNFIDSPIAKDTILNLSGLDFESSFKQTDTQDVSPSKLLRKKQISKKIAKLKYYGEPPPLSPMNIIHKSKNVTSAFKSPLTSRNDSANIASNDISTPLRTDRIDKENSNLQSSPVLSTGRSVVKRIISVNPVKLNFNTDEVCEKKENTLDPFAEEFDASPPLSLD